MRPWMWLALGAVAFFAAAAETIRRLSTSAKATELGIDNTPVGVDKRRLQYAATFEVPIRLILTEKFPDAHVTSGYRAPAVNKAVGGAGGTTTTRADDSYHTLGLALDFGGIGGLAETRRAARHLRALVGQLPAAPRTIIAETDHVHVDFFDPFGEYEQPRATAWLEENPAGTPRYVALA